MKVQKCQAGYLVRTRYQKRFQRMLLGVDLLHLHIVAVEKLYPSNRFGEKNHNAIFAFKPLIFSAVGLIAPAGRKRNKHFRPVRVYSILPIPYIR